MTGDDTINLIPSGGIIAWNGNVAPTGWALCNGQNGTPDLRGRFIRMTSSDLDNEPGATHGFVDYVVGRKSKTGIIPSELIGNKRSDPSSYIFKMNIGEIGGTDHHILDINEMPAHNHDIKVYTGNNYKLMGPGTYNRNFGSGGYNSYDSNEPPLPLSNVSFNGTSSYVGGFFGHNNMPPYYVLTYIMKL